MKPPLSNREFEAIQTAIFELNSHSDLTEFRKALPGIMTRLIPADYFVWNEILFLKGTPHAVDFVGIEGGDIFAIHSAECVGFSRTSF